MLGLIVKQLCEPEQRCCGQRYREFEIVDVQSASPIGGFNVSQCAGRQAAIRHELAYSDVEQYANCRVGTEAIERSTGSCERTFRRGHPRVAGSSTGGRRSSIAPKESKISLSAAWNSCSLLSKWL
jgi:hypothetical protein